MADIVKRISYAMSLRTPQTEALSYLDAISANCDYKKDSKAEIEAVASAHCEGQREIKIADQFDFPSFCYAMATGIGKTRLMGACIYYLYKTKGYRHFFVLAPGNTIYEKLRKESNPAHPKYIFKGLEAEMGRPKVYDGENYTSYPTRYEQMQIKTEKTSEIQLFIFNIGKIFNNRTDTQFNFHKFKEELGMSFADVLSSFDIDDPKTQDELYASYLKIFGAARTRNQEKEDDSAQMTLFPTLEDDSANIISEDGSIQETEEKKKRPASKEAFVQKLREYSAKAISVPKILIQTTSTVTFHSFEVKRTIQDFEVAMAKIERFDAINQQMLTSVDAQILEVDDAMNTLACMLLDSVSELSWDDADLIIDMVGQYLAQIEGDDEQKRKVVRRYAALIVEDLRKQLYEHMDRQTHDIHIVQKDLILFQKFVKSVKRDGKVRFDKPFADKANIKKYLFTGYKKAYYPENAFDSDSERLFSVILEEDDDVIRWIKPPLNQLGLFWQAGQQYNPDFLIETTSGKFMVEVKASKEITADDVVAKACEGIKWCRFASAADPDHKVWEYRLISDDNIKPGNTCKYTLGTAHRVEEG